MRNEQATATSPEEIAKEAVSGRMFADIKAMNRVGKALGYDENRVYVVQGTVKVHIAEKVASDNLSNASDEALLKAITTQEKVWVAQEMRRVERISNGRTRGAGAGGYNRDIDRIEHHINDAKAKIAALKGELARRQGGA